VHTQTLTPTSACTSRKEAWGRDILAISALAIVLTAPLGAVAITTAGPLLLRKE
jgi:hypothetical protein